MKMTISSEASLTTNRARFELFAHFIKREKKEDFDPAYIAVQEVSQNNKPRYHTLFLLHENKIQSIATHIKNANEALNYHLKLALNDPTGHINDCSKNSTPRQFATIPTPTTHTSINKSR